jgi:hypothetical protein
LAIVKIIFFEFLIDQSDDAIDTCGRYVSTMRHPEFFAGCGESQEVIPAVATFVAAGGAADLALDDLTTDSFTAPLVRNGISSSAATLPVSAMTSGSLSERLKYPPRLLPQLSFKSLKNKGFWRWRRSRVNSSPFL